jgi:Zn-dependent protease
VACQYPLRRVPNGLSAALAAKRLGAERIILMGPFALGVWSQKVAGRRSATNPGGQRRPTRRFGNAALGWSRPPVAAGPAATLAVIVATVFAAHLVPEVHTSASLVLDRVLSYTLGFNALALAVNLLPFRPLDGGQLLAATRLAVARGR